MKKIIVAIGIAVFVIAILYTIISTNNYRQVVSLNEQMKDHMYSSYIQNMKELKDELGQGISNGEFGEQDIVNLNKTRTRIDDYFYAYQVSLFPLKEDKSEEFQKIRDIYARFNEVLPKTITSQDLVELNNSYKNIREIIDEAVQE
ncbi:hypothetical protein [Paenibacillus sp. FSL K6-2862]|uniref:hypothetical protein n=1 Tax=Paenibacillus sp. FSL K6-2862 TaxID=2921484 RepID=UPI0030FA5DCD